MACKSSANMEISTVLNSQRRPAIPASDLLPAQKERKLSTPLVQRCMNQTTAVAFCWVTHSAADCCHSASAKHRLIGHRSLAIDGMIFSTDDDMFLDISGILPHLLQSLRTLCQSSCSPGHGSCHFALPACMSTRNKDWKASFLLLQGTCSSTKTTNRSLTCSKSWMLLPHFKAKCLLSVFWTPWYHPWPLSSQWEFCKSY